MYPTVPITVPDRCELASGDLSLRPRLRPWVAASLASPKSRIFTRLIFGDEDVVGFDVAVNDAFFVGGREAVGRSESA